jgi:hypothetical protein
MIDVRGRLKAIALVAVDNAPLAIRINNMVGSVIPGHNMATRGRFLLAWFSGD